MRGEENILISIHKVCAFKEKVRMWKRSVNSKNIDISF